MVSVANEGQIDGRGFQVRIGRRAHDTRDILQARFAHLVPDVLDKRFGNVDGKHVAVGSHLLGKQSREQPAAGADVRDDHSGLNPTGRKNFLPFVECLSPFAFKPFHPLFDLKIGSLEVLVDSRFDARLLGRSHVGERQANQHQR
jgi:hypothetical protein